MNLNDEYTVLEDGVEIGTFDTYEKAFNHMAKHAVEGRKYQFVRKFFAMEKKPPTAADTGWKDEYRGMWAEHKRSNKVFLMLEEDGERVRCLTNRTKDMWCLKKDNLIPRYDLARVDITPHPAYLETLEDYENAPTYTMIGSAWSANFPSLVKDISGKWTEIGSDSSGRSAIFAGDRRKVLYWPPQEEGGASA